MQAPLKGVIFDFDGLIIDTETPAYEAWAAIFREHGSELKREAWMACVGASDSPFDPVSHLQELTGRADLSRIDLIADKERRKAEVSDRLEPLPGVVDRLREARSLGLPIGLASSSHAAWVVPHLERVGLKGYFDVIRTRDDVQRAKPYPDLPLAAAAGLKLAPQHCLVLEDSLNGLMAAKAAGTRCFVFPNPVTIGNDFSKADAVLSSMNAFTFAELLKRYS